MNQEIEPDFNESPPANALADQCELWIAIAMYIGIDLNTESEMVVTRNYSGKMDFRFLDHTKQMRFFDLLSLTMNSPKQPFFIQYGNPFPPPTAMVDTKKFFQWLREKPESISKPEPNWLESLGSVLDNYVNFFLTHCFN